MNDLFIFVNVPFSSYCPFCSSPGLFFFSVQQWGYGRVVENVGSGARLPGITCLLCVTLDKLPNSFETQFPPLYNGDLTIGVTS